MSELVTREIELYKKLKRSLINEVVTGKREVAQCGIIFWEEARHD